MATDAHVLPTLQPMLSCDDDVVDIGERHARLSRQPSDDHGSLTRGQGYGHGNLPRTQISSMTRGQGIGSLTRGQVAPELLPVPSEVCQRDTRVLAALFIILLVIQVAHACFLAYKNVDSFTSMDLDTSSGAFVAAEVLFPLLLALVTIPGCMWLMANVWEFCHKGLWAKLKLRGGFIAYHVSVGLSTMLYVSYIMYLMGTNYNAYIDSCSTDASCYCTEMVDPELGISNLTYQCCCHVPEEETPWMLSSVDLDLIDDTSLQRRGSNYSGDVTSVAYQTSEEVHAASELYFPDFKKLVYYMELCVLTLGIRTMCWGWTSDYGGRDMTHLDPSITIHYLRDHRIALLQHSLYCFLEGVDIYSLFTILMEHARVLVVNRSMASGIMAVIGLGSFFVHSILPLAFVKCVPAFDTSREASNKNKFIAFISSMHNMILSMKMMSVILNVMLLILRVLLFKMLGGLDSMNLPNVFFLFMLKELYVIGQKGSEFFIEWWDLQQEFHYDDD